MAVNDSDMKIHEQLTLLLLDEHSGKLHGGERGRLSLVAAIIADLLIDGCVEMDEKTRLTTTVENPVHPNLRAMYDAIVAHPRRKLYQHVSSNERRASTLTLSHMTEAGLLETFEGSTWLIFPAECHRVKDANAFDQLTESLRATLIDDANMTPSTAALLALAHDARVLTRHIPQALEDQIDVRLRQLAQDNQYAKTLRYVIRAREAAGTAAVVAGSGASIG